MVGERRNLEKLLRSAHDLQRRQKTLAIVRSSIGGDVSNMVLPQEKTVWQKLLEFFEHVWVISALSVIGALVGFFYTPVFIVCGVGILLAFRRVGVVHGKKAIVQVPSYMALFLITTGGLYEANQAVKKNLPHNPTVAEIVDALKKSSVPTPPPVNTPSGGNPSLRIRGSRLATDSLRFMADQTKTTSNDQEILELFRAKFGPRYLDITEELANQGLQDSVLNLVGNKSPLYTRDVQGAIRDYVNRLNDLLVLVPPDGLYRDLSNEDLGEQIIFESEKLNAMAEQTLHDIEHPNPPGMSRDIYRMQLRSDFEQCCQVAVRGMRGVAIQRLVRIRGPVVLENQEMTKFYALMKINPTNSYEAVSDFVPHFRKLGQLTKELSARPHPVP
jgi:hypothetical protein